jgi:flagellar motility protein MotE (MotC chaperone)
VEVLKERLQRQADVAARAELALTQLAVTSQATQAALTEQVEEAREQATELAAGRKELEAEYERLRAERQGLKSELAAARVGGWVGCYQGKQQQQQQGCRGT